jgi:hypothetical protein
MNRISLRAANAVLAGLLLAAWHGLRGILR